MLSQDHWTPITINVIKKITIFNIYNAARIYMNGTDSIIFYGAGYSSFYIRYLHP